MLRQFVALGPEFDHLPNDTEESLVGTSLHKPPSRRSTPA